MNEEQFRQTIIKLSGYKKTRQFKKIGIVFDTLGPSQALVTLLPDINNCVNSLPYIDFSLFFVENECSPIKPKVSCYQAMDAWFLEGDLIATSFNSLKCINEFANSNIYYYIQDLEYKRPYFNDEKEEYSEIISNDKITKIFRCKDHVKQMVSDNIISHNANYYVISDLTVKPILEIVNA